MVADYMKQLEGLFQTERTQVCALCLSVYHDLSVMEWIHIRLSTHSFCSPDAVHAGGGSPSSSAFSSGEGHALPGERNSGSVTISSVCVNSIVHPCSKHLCLLCYSRWRTRLNEHLQAKEEDCCRKQNVLS